MVLIRSSGSRDVRVDFFRGLALWWIFIDHIPGDTLADYASLHDVALCDAAEIFVLLAGFGAGKAYASVMDRDGYLYGAADAVKRAWTLYVAHIFLFVVYAAQVSYGATALDRSNYLDESRLNVLADRPYQALLQALTLQYQPNLLNILPLYVALLLMFAAVMPLLRWPKLLGALSLGLYILVRAEGFDLPSWIDDGWYFNPLTWQLLFIIGAILAYAPPRRLPALPGLLDACSWAVVIGGLVVIFGIWRHQGLAAALPWRVTHALMAIDKTNLDPPRLISILALLWLTVRLVPAQAPWLLSWPARPFVLMGQHSLPVFCFGIFIGFFGRMALEYSDAAPMQVLVNIGGMVSMVAVAALAAWYGERGRSSRRPAPLSPALSTVTQATHDPVRGFGPDGTAPAPASRGISPV
jgi:hypothetical protein